PVRRDAVLRRARPRSGQRRARRRPGQRAEPDRDRRALPPRDRVGRHAVRLRRRLAAEGLAVAAPEGYRSGMSRPAWPVIAITVGACGPNTRRGGNGPPLPGGRCGNVPDCAATCEKGDGIACARFVAYAGAAHGGEQTLERACNAGAAAACALFATTICEEG